MEFSQLLGNALLGFLLVFLVLAVLMGFIALMNKLFSLGSGKKTVIEPPRKPLTKKTAPPEVILSGISERDAAMVMAIVANESGIPLEELRFISIREVEDA